MLALLKLYPEKDLSRPADPQQGRLLHRDGTRADQAACRGRPTPSVKPIIAPAKERPGHPIKISDAIGTPLKAALEKMQVSITGRVA